MEPPGFEPGMKVQVVPPAFVAHSVRSALKLSEFQPRSCFVYQPRIAVLGYPGKRSMRSGCPTPTGLWLLPAVVEGDATDALYCIQSAAGSRNPVGVGVASRSFPRVAEYRNPGLVDETPSG